MEINAIKGKLDFGIITIREDEFRAVLSRFPAHDHAEGHRRYAISDVRLNNGSHNLVAVVRSPEQGEGEAQDVARDMIIDLDPRWLLLVGIAGGVPAFEFTLGDVVVATRLIDFSVKAAVERHRPEYAVGGGPMHKLVQIRLAQLPAMEGQLVGWDQESSIGMSKPPVQFSEENFYGSPGWQRKTKEVLEHHFGPLSSPRPPLVTTGAIASSDELMKDTKTLKARQEVARQIQAVEMELAGVYRAARRKDHEYPIVAIRGISDIVGFKRHHGWTTYACNSAAAFAYALVTSRILEDISLQSSQHTEVLSDNGEPERQFSISGTVSNLTELDRAALVDFLVRSGRAAVTSRKALCLEIGVDPDELPFLDIGAVRDFAQQFVEHLYRVGDTSAVYKLCGVLSRIFREPYLSELVRIRNKLK